MKYFLTAICVVLCLGSVAAQTTYVIEAGRPSDSSYVDSVVRVTHGRLQQLLGHIPSDSLRIYIVTTERAFDSLAGAAIPDWGAAVAVPLRRRIVIKSPREMRVGKTLGELTAHEYGHIVLSRAVNYQSVPRWLDEGLAMYVSAEWGWEDNLAMGWAVIMDDILPLKEIEYLNRFHDSKARLAYSESYLGLRYFLDMYGASGLRILIGNLKFKRDIDYAFITATGADYAAFENEFSIYLKGRYNVIAILFNSNIIWILLAFVIIIGFILNRLRRKRRFKEMDEYDVYHSTDFDYGDVEEPDEDKPWD